MEGVDDFPRAPWLWGNRGSRGIDMGHQISNSIKGEGSLNKLPQSDMVVSLVEKQRRGTNQTLFAFGVGGLEQVCLSHQHKLCSLRASQHHTWTPKNMGLENFPIPTKNTGNYWIHKLNWVIENRNEKTDCTYIYTHAFSVWQRRKCLGPENRAEESLQYKANPMSLEGD